MMVYVFRPEERLIRELVSMLECWAAHHFSLFSLNDIVTAAPIALREELMGHVSPGVSSAELLGVAIRLCLTSLTELDYVATLFSGLIVEHYSQLSTAAESGLAGPA